MSSQLMHVVPKDWVFTKAADSVRLRPWLPARPIWRVLLLLIFCAWITTSSGQVAYYVVTNYPGFNYIANQLDTGENTLSEVLPDVPDGTRFFKWNAAAQTYGPAFTFDAGPGWGGGGPIPVLNPGEGGVLQDGGDSPFAAYFVGTLRVPVLPIAGLGAGSVLVSRQVPGAGTYENIVGAPPAVGALVDRFDALAQSSTRHTFTGGGWDPAAPLAVLGESVFISGPAPLAGYSNATFLTIPSSGPASSYPSTIQLAGLPGRITGVMVALNGLTHGYLDDLDILLVGPLGQTVMLMSDAGGTTGMTNATLHFTDHTPELLPDNSAILPGVYRPSNWAAADILGAPAPSAPHGTNLSVFNGTSPNGTWRLYVWDDEPGVSGSVAGGWTLRLGLVDPPVIIAHPQSQTVSAGATATFAVVASGAAPLSSQWTFNGSDIPGATSTNFAFVAQPTDAGQYRVRVSNPGGSILSDVATLSVSGSPSSLVVWNADWTYSAATNLGAAWKNPGYDDSAWASGAAPLGFPADEVLPQNLAVQTVLDAGPITYYFRHTFINNTDPGGVGLVLSNFCDDGCVVYLNGSEIARFGMNPGPVQYDTLAARTGDIGTGRIDSLSLPGLQLVVGANVLAVEVHQVASTSSDLIQATALALTEADTSPPVALRALWEAANRIRASFSEPVQTPADDPFTYSVVGPSSLTVISAAISNETNVLLTVSPNRDPDAGYQLYITGVQDLSGNVSDPTSLPVAAPQTLFDLDQVWRFNQDGQDLGSAWKEPGFDDSAWPSGAGLLGEEITGDAVPLLRTDLAAPAEGGPSTIYFRTSFNLATPPASLVELELEHYLDDGAVVYLNGLEVHRLGVPPGQGAATLADRTVLDATVEGPFQINLAQLHLGSNLMAVEVHQVSSNSSDVVWGARLTVYPLLPPQITQQPGDQTVALGGTATFSVMVSGSPPFSYQWRKDGVPTFGGTDRTLVLLDATPNDAGNYDVVVSSPLGAVVSAPARLRVALPSEGGDDLNQPVPLAGLSGSVSWMNTLYSRQPGEPYHFGKFGTNSVWYVWQAPATDIATFDTTGSSFDTLLAVYHTNAAQITEVASDDDRGGNLASWVQFNAVAGTHYLIAVDGLAGETGTFILSWQLEQFEQTIPVITTQPASQTVLPSTNAVFTVTATGVGLRYQWFKDQTPVAGATSRQLVIPSVQPADLGDYTVWVTNSSGRTAQSLPAQLQIGSDPDVRTVYKIGDIIGLDALEQMGGGGGTWHALDTGTGGTGRSPIGQWSVSVGTIHFQRYSNADTDRPPTRINCEPDHCDVPGGKPDWVRVEAKTDGICLIDTEGSEIDTVVAVYAVIAGKACSDIYLQRLACNHRYDDCCSRLGFYATAGSVYRVVIDGSQGADGKVPDGNIQVNLRFRGLPHSYPMDRVKPLSLLGRRGEALLLEFVPASPTAGTTYQWRKDGTDLLLQQKNSLPLPFLNFEDGGQYQVVATTGSLVETAEAVVAVADIDPMSGLVRVVCPVPMTLFSTNGLRQPLSTWSGQWSVPASLPAAPTVLFIAPGWTRYFGVEPKSP